MSFSNKPLHNIAEGIGTHAKKVIQIMEGMFEEKLDQAEKIFPQYSWKYAPAQLDELLQNGEKTKVGFEKGGWGQGLTIDQFGYKDHIQC